MRGLNGKVVVVAGGAGGIGTACSVRLAEEGATVVVGDVNRDAADAVAAQITATGGSAISIHLDIADEDSVAALIAFAVKDVGDIDGVHANAADRSTTRADTRAVAI